MRQSGWVSAEVCTSRRDRGNMHPITCVFSIIIALHTVTGISTYANLTYAPNHGNVSIATPEPNATRVSLEAGHANETYGLRATYNNTEQTPSNHTPGLNMVGYSTTSTTDRSNATISLRKENVSTPRTTTGASTSNHFESASTASAPSYLVMAVCLITSLIVALS